MTTFSPTPHFGECCLGLRIQSSHHLLCQHAPTPHTLVHYSPGVLSTTKKPKSRPTVNDGRDKSRRACEPLREVHCRMRLSKPQGGALGSCIDRGQSPLQRM